MRIGEEKIQLSLAQLVFQRRLLVLDLCRQVGVVRRQRGQLDQIARPLLQRRPAGDLVAELTRLTRQATRRLRVVPDAGLGEPPVELG